ncbi:putative mucin/carbohydrate-binding domain-containing protein [Listeria cornellensis]|uniref:putative mucin/carbohydrate-binding domain-containing protein n=1 Tax=Listeria cornellensis TaxID=1494961 RepID=UPI00068A327A|nr:putative mucin/carbohydrate-binding domain-containing protein [Listeria cornellensis]
MSSFINPANITILGLAEWKIGDLNVDLEKEQLAVDFNKIQANFWFSEDLYVKIQVLDAEGKEMYTKSRMGSSDNKVSDKVTIKEGYKIKVFHAELEFLRFNNQKMVNENTTFVVTKSGLQVESLGAHGLDWVLAKIDDTAKQIRNNPSMLASDYSTLKDDVLLAIQNLPEQTRAEAMIDYKDVLPKDLTQQKPTSINAQSELNAETTNTGKLAVGVLPEAADQNVNFESSNQNVIKVDENGKWQAIGKGGAVITVTSKVDGHIKKNNYRESNGKNGL